MPKKTNTPKPPKNDGNADMETGLYALAKAVAGVGEELGPLYKIEELNEALNGIASALHDQASISRMAVIAQYGSQEEREVDAQLDSLGRVTSRGEMPPRPGSVRDADVRRDGHVHLRVRVDQNVLQLARVRHVGELAGRANNDDVVDVTVVEGAVRRGGQAVVTSNEAHIQKIASAAGERLLIEAV